MQVKINGKNYTVPQMGFKDMAAMEEIAGTSLINIFQKNQAFILAEAFVGAVAGCDKEEAGRLCEQHVMGGGDLADIYEAFTKAVNESGFFKKVLGLEKAKGASGKKTEAKEEQTP